MIILFNISILANGYKVIYCKKTQFNIMQYIDTSIICQNSLRNYFGKTKVNIYSHPILNDTEIYNVYGLFRNDDFYIDTNIINIKSDHYSKNIKEHLDSTRKYIGSCSMVYNNIKSGNSILYLIEYNNYLICSLVPYFSVPTIRKSDPTLCDTDISDLKHGHLNLIFICENDELKLVYHALWIK